jgi:Zn-dependent protease with chaperone function
LQCWCLYQLTDAVARELGAEPASVIIINGDFNAAHARIGLRRRPVLWLGLPLWDILRNSERVALLAHEFAHQVNGDPAHGLVVGSAIRTLADWHRLLHPRFRWKRTRSLFDFAELIGSAFGVAVMRAIGSGVGAVLRLELSLNLRSSQEAEYFADQLAARVASASAAVSLTERLHLAKPCTQAIQFAARRGKDPWAAGREFVATLPPRELERLRRIDALHGTAIDASHPPTTLRVALLVQNTAADVRVTLSDDSAAAITCRPR